MLVLSSVFSGLEFWSVNLISIYENSELNFVKNITFLAVIYSNWSSSLLGINV